MRRIEHLNVITFDCNNILCYCFIMMPQSKIFIKSKSNNTWITVTLVRSLNYSLATINRINAACVLSQIHFQLWRLHQHVTPTFVYQNVFDWAYLFVLLCVLVWVCVSVWAWVCVSVWAWVCVSVWVCECVSVWVWSEWRRSFGNLPDDTIFAKPL